MILEFKTPRNKTNGARRYLKIDTDEKTFTRFCPRMIPEGIEISPTAYRELCNTLSENGYLEVQ